MPISRQGAFRAGRGAALVAMLTLASTGGATSAPDSDSEITKQFIAKADALIQDNNLDVKSTPHYKVKTDDPRFDVVSAATLLESFRAFFDSFWQGRAELLP